MSWNRSKLVSVASVPSTPPSGGSVKTERARVESNWRGRRARDDEASLSRLSGFLRRSTLDWRHRFELIRAGGASAVLAALAGALVLIYVLVFTVRLPVILRWWGSDSDIAAAYLLPSAIFRGHSGLVSMGTQGSWVSLWFGLLVAKLPGHRVLWQIAPIGVLVASGGLIAWSVAAIGDRRAALASFGLLLVASPTGLQVLTEPYLHNTTVLGVAGLGAYAVWLTRARRRRSVWVSGIGAGVVAGTLIASDPLFAVVGLCPFALTALLAGLRSRDYTLCGSVTALCTVALIGTDLTNTFMRDLGFSAVSPHTGFAGPLLGEHILWLATGLLHFTGGLAVTHAGAMQSIVTEAIAALTVAAVLGLLLAGRKCVGALLSGRASPTAIFSTYWSGVFVATVMAYVCSNAALVPSDRYLVTAFLALVATAPMIWSKWPRAVLAALAIVALANTGALIANQERGTLPAVVPYLHRIELAAQRAHVSLGYAGYWQADALTWRLHEDLHVYPVTVTGRTLGPTPGVARVAAWYRPRAHTASFLLITPNDRDVPLGFARLAPRPSKVIMIGPIDMLVYKTDLAARLTRSGSTS